MTSPQDNRIFHFPPWGPGEPIESYRHRKRLAFDTWSAQRSALLARTDSAGRPLYRVTSGGNIGGLADANQTPTSTSSDDATMVDDSTLAGLDAALGL